MKALLERQRAFTKSFFADRGLDLDALDSAERVRWLKDYVLHIEAELHEFLGEFNWKMHRPVHGGDAVYSNALEEWVDAFKLLLGMALIMGFSEEEVRAEFNRKSAVVELRYEQERTLAALPADAVVVGVDVDGVLAEYPGGFIDWIRGYWAEQRAAGGLRWDGGKGDLLERLTGVRSSQELRRVLGVETYEALKDTYRQSGAKAHLAVRPGARQLLSAVRGAGAKVVVLSARPYRRYGRIFADTLTWLEANGLHYDAILFDEEKHLQIVRRFPRLRAMVEDTPAQARAVGELGYRVFVPDTADNESYRDPLPATVSRHPDLHDLRDALLDHLTGT